MLTFTARNHNSSRKTATAEIAERWGASEYGCQNLPNGRRNLARSITIFAERRGMSLLGSRGFARRFSGNDEKLAGKARSAGNQRYCPRYGSTSLRLLQARWKTHCANEPSLGIVNHDGAFAEYLALR